MKKIAAAVATGILLAGVTVSNVSAEEVEVHKGDSLWKISQDHNTTVDELKTLNNLESTIIHPDQILVTSEEKEEQSTDYTVEKGDTLSGIGNNFDVTVQNLKSWNNLNSDIISVGQVLAVSENNAAESEVEVNDEAVSADVQEEEPKEEPKEEVMETPQEEPEEEEEEPEEVVAKPKEDVNEEPEKVTEEPKEETDEEVNNEVQEEPEETTEEPQEAVKDESDESNSEAPEGKTMTVSSTAYTAACDGCSGVTATGVDLNDNPNQKVIAVDPDVIPLGSKVYVEGYGEAIAADTGGAINGEKIDLHVSDKDEANSYGVQDVNITVIE